MFKSIWNRSLLLALIAELNYVGLSAMVKLASPSIPLAEIIFFRALFTLVAAFFLMRQYSVSFRPHNLPILSLRSIAAFLSMICGFYAIGHLALGDAMMLIATFPLFVPLFSMIVLKKKPTRKLMVFIFIAWIGILLIIRPNLDFFNTAGVIALLAALLAGIDITTLHLAHRTDHTLRLIFYFMALATAASFTSMLVSFVIPTGLEVVWLLGTGLFGTVFQVTVTRAYGIGNISRLAPFIYVGVVLSYILGILFWGEIPNLWTIVGCTIVMACCLKIAKTER